MEFLCFHSFINLVDRQILLKQYTKVWHIIIMLKTECIIDFKMTQDTIVSKRPTLTKTTPYCYRS